MISTNSYFYSNFKYFLIDYLFEKNKLTAMLDKHTAAESIVEYIVVENIPNENAVKMRFAEHVFYLIDKKLKY